MHTTSIATLTGSAWIDARAIDADDEPAVIAAAAAGDSAAYERLLNAYAPLLRKEAKITTALVGDTEEAWSVVLLAFVEAVRSAAERNLARLGGALKTAAHNERDEAPTPAAMRIPHTTSKRYAAALKEANGDFSRALELAPSHELSPETFLAIAGAIGDWSSLEAEGEATEDGTARPAWAYEVGYSRVEDAVTARRALASVEGVTREVVEHAYGFRGYRPLSDAAVAEELGYSRSKVQRIHQKGLETMRDALGVVGA